MVPRTNKMTKRIEDVVCCVVDSGLFPHIAQCLAQKVKHCFYCGPRDQFMPKLADAIVGDGFDNITRVREFWGIKEQCDLFVFTDIGLDGEQRELTNQGFRVWGHHGGDVLEWNKARFLSTLEDLGMPSPPHTRVRGMTALRDLLMDAEDKYVKISRYRGDWETFHWRNREMDEACLDAAAYRLGPAKELITFYVFDPIDTKIEDGVDAWCIDGEWPKTVLHAMERKDKSLIGAMQKFADVAEPVRQVNEKFGPVLAEFGYRGAFSSEVRLNDQAFFIDPTCRFGSPPSQLQTALITNLPEVIYAGAQGVCLEPEAPEPFGAQVLITTDREKAEWAAMELPEELLEKVKASFSCQIDNLFCIAPNPLENWFGWLVATGKDIYEVIDRMKEYKEMLPDGFDCDITSLCDLLKELRDAEEKGVEITNQEIPEPETIIQ